MQNSPQPVEDQPVAISPPAAVSGTKHAPLSSHAEDVLADTVGHEVDLQSDPSNTPPKTIKEVLTEIVGDKDELVITLEYGTGESGVDQASWGIELASLQRAFVKKQKTAELNALSERISTDLRSVIGKIDKNWAVQTSGFSTVQKIFQRSIVTRQEVDDFNHQIFDGGSYLGYLESVLSGKDEGGLLVAASNLSKHVKEIEIERAEMCSPANVDNNQLADAIIAVQGDIDKLSIELERDMAPAILRRNLARASRVSNMLTVDALSQYKLWAHSFQLNVREVLATERSAVDGRISDKSRDQLREMLAVGEDQVTNLLQISQ